MKDRIYEFVTERPWASFAELCDNVEGFKGEYILHPASFPNLIVWPSCSREGVVAFGELMAEGRIALKPCDPLVYWIDGTLPNLPLAKNFRDYKSPRWFPATIAVPSQVEHRIPNKGIISRLC